MVPQAARIKQKGSGSDEEKEETGGDPARGAGDPAGGIICAAHGEPENRRGGDEKAAEQKIYVTDISSMMKIRYQSGTDGMTFEKTADQETWIYMEDPDFPLAQQYPEEMENTFEKLEVKRELKDGDELSSYGLDEPQYQVTLTDQDGTETTLYFGNAVDDGYYLTVDDTKTVYTVGNVIDVFQHSLEEMAQLDEYPNIGSGNLKRNDHTKWRDDNVRFRK